MFARARTFTITLPWNSPPPFPGEAGVHSALFQGHKFVVYYHAPSALWRWEVEHPRVQAANGTAATKLLAQEAATDWMVDHLLAPVLRPVTSGVDVINQERRRQIHVEGWSPEHDAGHTQGQLVIAAIAYALTAHDLVTGKEADPSLSKDRENPFWPWDKSWWKPNADPIRMLAKAGSLLAAEVCRLQGLPPPPEGEASPYYPASETASAGETDPDSSEKEEYPEG